MTPHAHEVAIVTGGSSGTGRAVASDLARHGWAIVVVYLENQQMVEASVAAILAADGDAVAVRADLCDDLDVERLFAESRAAFGDVDVVVHTMTESVPLLYLHAARHVRCGGVILTVLATDRLAPAVARRLHERGITVGRAPPDELLDFLYRWRRD